jgi:hypothetical protein
MLWSYVKAETASELSVYLGISLNDAGLFEHALKEKGVSYESS